MRINIFAIIVFCSSLLGFLYISQFATQKEVIYEDIQDNFTALLQAQQQDLQDFSYKLSVYTNPFSIQGDDDAFAKRVYLNGSLVYWNSSEPLPEYNSLKKKDSIYLVSNKSGLDLVQRVEIVTENELVEIFSVLPIYSDPPVKNQYLHERLNPKIFDNYSVRIEPTSSTDKSVFDISHNQEVLFSIVVLKDSSLETEIYSLLFLLLIIVSFSILLHRFFKKKFSSRRYQTLFLITSLIVVRFLLHLWTRNNIEHWELFDPAFFTSGWLYYTLGDLLLHSILLLYILVQVYIYVHKTGLDNIFEKDRNTYRFQFLISFGLSFFLIILSLFSYQTIWVLLENSQLELDINRSIQFDFLRICAYTSIVLVGLTVVVAFTLIVQLVNNLKLYKGILYSVLLSVCIFFALAAGPHAYVYVGLFLVGLFAIDFFKLGRKLRDLRYQTFVYLVVIFSVFSSVFAFAVYKHFEKDELVAKEKFGNRLLIKNDILGELFLSEIVNDIENDAYIRTRLLSRLLSRQNIREKIKKQFLSSYFKKYDINVYLFDSKGNSLQPDLSPKSYQEWEEQYRKEKYGTDYPKIYYIEDEDEHVRNKYICFMDIEAYSRKVGYIILDLTLKKYIPTSVFPELLLESKYYLGTGSEYDYAVFKNGQVLYKQGRFSFENKLSSNDLKNEKLYTSGIEKRGTHYYGLKTSEGESFIIISSTYDEQSLVTNFSIIFLLLLFSSGIILLLMQVYRSSTTFYLSTKIQLYLGLSFILPMLIVSIALLNTLNASYREEIDRNFQKRSYNIAENLIDPTEMYFNGQINRDEYANHISEAGALVQSDLNVYDLTGRLVTSSQPEIFRLGLLSNLLDPEAYYNIRYKKEQNLISEKSIGELDFKTSYTGLRSYQDGRLLGILSMPYFDSKNHLRRQQIEVFGNLISIFTAIFLISLAVGNVIVGQLIRPLRKIGDKLRQTSLQEKNLPIFYETEDEIGSLIKEYNLMLIKLEESKAALAVSQKESAWKEIARQVAHEIKNPLTPMRLKVQQMMRTFEPGEKNYKTCEILIAQVDSLSSIADSFSEFAKMPAPNHEPTNLPKLLESIISLHQSKEVVIKKKFEEEELFVFVDRKIFNRIFTNILLNAIQSKEKGIPIIEVDLAKSNSKVTISIKDNGPGIPEELKDNIFTPYFSTKSKGSGIGLAVAKKGIENAGGNIWFESEGGKGTTFFISLPIYKE